jgi:hypothetical protein
LSKEIVKVNDHVLQVVIILFLGTYSTILGGLGGIKKQIRKINPFRPENPPRKDSSSPDLNPSESSPNSWAKLECREYIMYAL